jgi:hypothetical protein
VRVETGLVEVDSLETVVVDVQPTTGPSGGYGRFPRGNQAKESQTEFHCHMSGLALRISPAWDH